jgi:PAS domain S-box-containing protein
MAPPIDGSALVRALRLHTTVVSCALLAAVFAADMQWRAAVTLALLYVPVVLAGLATQNPRRALWLAVFATGLTVVPLAIVEAAAFGREVADRTLTIVVLWITAVGVTMYRFSTDRHEQSLRDLEDIRQALDQSAIVAVTDVPGRIKFVNDKFCEISKYRRDELVGQDHRILNSGFHSREFIRDLWVTIANGRVWRGEIRNRAKDGSLYWVDTTIVPFLDARGKPWQYMAIRYDITARKAQEQRLRDQAALAAIGEFAAVVAHEVRNPLSGIRNGVQLIASELPPLSDNVSLSADIVARIDGLNTVIEDLLAFARPRELRPSTVNVRFFLANVITGFGQDPGMKGVSVMLDAPEDLFIDADPDQLRLVFMNLLMNAGQAMAGHGDIEVRATWVPDEGCVLTVRDHGPGVAAEARERVFEPFFTTKRRGTGLGLPTVKRVVDAHHGAVTVEPAPTGGTVVRVVLPSRQPAPASV